MIHQHPSNQAEHCKKSLNAKRRSRIVGFVLVIIMAGSLAGIGLNFLTSRTVIQATFVEAKIPPLADRDMEPQVRQHIESVHESCQRVIDNSHSAPTQRGRAYGELGKVYAAYSMSIPAIACLANAGRLDTGDFRWPYLQAHMHHKEGELGLAAAAMAEALRRIPDDPGATGANELAARCFLGEMAQRLDQPAEARQLFDDVLRMHPRCVFALFHRGQLAAQQEQGSAAIDDFLQALELMPHSSAIRASLATEYRKLGDRENADKYAVLGNSARKGESIAYADPLKASIDELNRSGSKANRIAVRLLEQGRVRAALAQLNAGLKHCPDSNVLRLNRALALIQLEQYVRAQSDLEVCLKLKPRDTTLRELMILAMVHVPATRAKGVEQARAWAADEPENALAQRLLGRSLIVLQNWEEALIAINHACRLAPDDIENRSLRIQCRCALGEYRTALEELTALHDEYSQDTSIAIRLIRLLAACPEETVRDGVRAVELAQQLLAAQQTAIGKETLACALHEVGRTKHSQRSMPPLKHVEKMACQQFGGGWTPSKRPSLRACLFENVGL